MKSIALVVVSGGVAYGHAPEHVDLRIVDLDNIHKGDDPVTMPKNIGFEELCLEAGIRSRKYARFV